MGIIVRIRNAYSLLLIYTIYISSGEAGAKTIKNFVIRRQPTIAESSNEFAFALQKTLPPTGNIIMSPWAISFALGMIAMGADGNTLKQMREAMFLTEISPDNIHYGFKQLREHLVRYDHEYEMNMFSTILVQERHNVSPAYKLNLKRYYDSDIQDVDFSHLGTLVTEWINVYTSLKTAGKIKSILTSVPNQDTVMLLLTANYFKGIWDESFNANETKSAKFYNDDGTTSEVEMMHATRNMSIYSGEKFAINAVHVPMKGDVSFMFILPQRPEEMINLQNNLSNAFVNEIYRDLSKEPVNLGVPKFEATSRIELEEPLEELGMRDLFSPNDANLSRISRNGGLSVQEVIHKASLQIDEEGAVASSVTVISIVSRIGAYKLHINRPFIFLIRDVKSKTILFMGRISKL